MTRIALCQPTALGLCLLPSSWKPPQVSLCLWHLTHYFEALHAAGLTNQQLTCMRGHVQAQAWSIQPSSRMAASAASSMWPVQLFSAQCQRQA